MASSPSWVHPGQGHTARHQHSPCCTPWVPLLPAERCSPHCPLHPNKKPSSKTTVLAQSSVKRPGNVHDAKLIRKQRFGRADRTSADIGWRASLQISGILSQFLSCGYPQPISIQTLFEIIFGGWDCIKQNVFLPESFVKRHWDPISFDHHIQLHREQKSHMICVIKPKQYFCLLFS